MFYKHLTTTTEENLTPGLTGDTYGDATLRLTRPGTHLLVFTNTPKYIELDPEKFLAYLTEDGLDNVIAARQQQGNTQKPGRELYRRSVKTLIQVGPAPDETFTKATGLPVDIIPVKNPYAQKPGDMAQFQIRFQQQPLSAVRVRYWNRLASGDTTIHQEEQRTDAQGRVSFRLRAGQNMVSVVRMIPNPNPAEADWQSFWGSLTFGCR